jgi:hypothetical protein
MECVSVFGGPDPDDDPHKADVRFAIEVDGAPERLEMRCFINKIKCFINKIKLALLVAYPFARILIHLLGARRDVSFEPPDVIALYLTMICRNFVNLCSTLRKNRRPGNFPDRVGRACPPKNTRNIF